MAVKCLSTFTDLWHLHHLIWFGCGLRCRSKLIIFMWLCTVCECVWEGEQPEILAAALHCLNTHTHPYPYDGQSCCVFVCVFADCTVWAPVCTAVVKHFYYCAESGNPLDPQFFYLVSICGAESSSLWCFWTAPSRDEPSIQQCGHIQSGIKHIQCVFILHML